MKIIYDFGANDGVDIPYYLLKADKVVAVEANPVLCQGLAKQYAREISSGRLVIENCVLSVEPEQDEVEFHIHRDNHALSQLPPPPDDLAGQFEKVSLPAASAPSIIQRHGTPHYIKIDIEHYDAPILRHLFESNIRPPYLSAESHSIDVFALMLALGNYRAFKLVDGRSVCRVYKTLRIESEQGSNAISFPFRAAGPFGNDVQGEWMTGDNFYRLLAYVGLGWKDIHVSSVDEPDPNATPNWRAHVRNLAKTMRRPFQ